MVEKKSKSLIKKICFGCGEYVLNKNVKKIMCLNQTFYFYYNCGSNLLKSNFLITNLFQEEFKKKYSDELRNNLLNTKINKSRNIKFTTRDVLDWLKLVEMFYSFITAYHFIKKYFKPQSQFKLIESHELNKNNHFYTYGFDNEGKSTIIKINKIYPNVIKQKIKLSTRFDYLTLESDQSVFRIDDDLEIWEEKADEIEIGNKILTPREFKVIVNNRPIDLKECGLVYSVKTQEYLTFGNEKIWEVPRFIDKSFGLGFILGQFISEGSMNIIDITSGTDKQLIHQVYEMVKRIFKIKFNISIEEKEDFKTLYKLRNESLLVKSIFTKGIGLKPALAHQKEIPPFLYNAPIDCIKGFLRGFILGDATLKEQIRKGTNLRNIKVRLYTSSSKLVFGLNFLFKRLGIISNLEIVKLSEKHPNWHDQYILHIHGKRNFIVLRQFIQEIPEPRDQAPGKKSVISLNPWLRLLNNELKEHFNTNFYNLYSNNQIQFPIHKLIYQGKNTSENYLLTTLEDLKKLGLTPPIFHKLYNILRYNTIDIVIKIKSKNTRYMLKRINTSEGNLISGLSQTYIS
ncbi:MAG: LAGLIDADG family homing endonuclease [Promethearchaeota archaeon]